MLTELHDNLSPNRSPLKDERLLIGVEEAARRLGLGRDRTYELVRKGELEHVRLGRLLKVTVAGLQRWVDRNVIPGTQ